MKLTKSQMQAGKEAQRLTASRELAVSLLDRFEDRLADWDLASLTQFMVLRSKTAEALGLVSKSDVYAFAETTLLLAPSLENTRQFRDAVVGAPDTNTRMLHPLRTLEPGFWAQITRPDAPSAWLDVFRQRHIL